MIIEAGYDVFRILEPKLYPESPTENATWVMAMDEDLRYLYRERVSFPPGETWVTAGPSIAKALAAYDIGVVKYFAIARFDSVHRCDENHLHDDHHAVDDLSELKTYTLLGLLLSDGEEVCSSVPRYSFRDYPSLSHLPRAAICPGPHKFLKCECLACTQVDERLARNRALAPRSGT